MVEGFGMQRLGLRTCDLCFKLGALGLMLRVCVGLEAARHAG